MLKIDDRVSVSAIAIDIDWCQMLVIIEETQQDNIHVSMRTMRNF